MIGSPRQRSHLQQRLFVSEEATGSLRRRSVRGGALTLVEQLTKLLLRTGTVIVLARLLSPADFGLIAMVLTVTNAGVMFKDAGLTDATLQSNSITHEQVSTLFWINVGVGLLIAVAIAGLGPAIAWFYDQPELVSISVALSTMFVFGGLTSQHQALLRRHLWFGRLAVVQIGAMLFTSSMAILAGYRGAGYWALVIMHVGLSFATAVGCWIALPWVPGRPRRGAGVRELVKFGLNVTGFNFLNYFSRNADNVLIGRFLGASALGFYSKAYSLMTFPISQIRTPIMGVGLPALSRLQNDQSRYRNYYERLLQTLVFVISPLTILLGVYAHEVVTLLLGDQWIPSADVFRILAFAAFVQVPNGTIGMVLLSSGNSHRLFRTGLAQSLITIFAFVVGISWGINGVALAYTVAVYATLVPMTLYALKPTPIPPRLYFRALFLPASASLLAALVSRIVFQLFSPERSLVFALVTVLATAVVVYLSCYVLFPSGRRVLRDLRMSVNSLRGSSSGKSV